MQRNSFFFVPSSMFKKKSFAALSFKTPAARRAVENWPYAHVKFFTVAADDLVSARDPDHPEFRCMTFNLEFDARMELYILVCTTNHTCQAVAKATTRFMKYQNPEVSAKLMWDEEDEADEKQAGGPGTLIERGAEIMAKMVPWSTDDNEGGVFYVSFETGPRKPAENARASIFIINFVEVGTAVEKLMMTERDNGDD